MSWVSSRRFQLSLFIILVFFSIFSLWRAAFFLNFFGFSNEYLAADVIKALYIGMKFDMRLALFMAFPLLVASILPRYGFFTSLWTRRIVDVLMTILLLVVMFLYVVDFSHYSYLAERMDASILRFFDTPDIALQMVWESYPVVLLTLLIITIGIIVSLVFKKVFTFFINKPKKNIPVTHALVGVALCIFLILHVIVGRWNAITFSSISMLRWSDAYFSRNQEVAALGLNPVLFLIDTFQNQSRPYDMDVLNKSEAIIKEYLNADVSMHSYRREAGIYETNLIDRQSTPPNIVLVMLESLGANRLGVFGNPLNATPALDLLASKGHLFTRFYVPSSGTARTVFGKITGIPDVSYGGTTATRNPKLVNQQVIINTLEDYEKFYFIGGGAQWANMQALLENNIDGIELYEEGDWEGKRIDVWGISDRSLLLESHEILEKRKNQHKPFFAVIQTAANHRPFTIPDDDSRFKIDKISDEQAIKHGFLGADQYNAVRLLDYNINFYFNELVKGSSYERNTLFLLYGDHNDRSHQSPHLPVDDALYLRKHHVPFIVYGPGLLTSPKSFETPMSLVDMIPSVLSLAGIPYVNTTLGRNIYEVDEDESYVITFGGDRRNKPHIGVVGRNYSLSMLDDGSMLSLHDLNDKDVKKNRSDELPELARKLKDLTMTLYHTSRYMMIHNKRKE